MKAVKRATSTADSTHSYAPIVAALGLDFVAGSGAAYIANLDGQVIWNNADYRRFAVSIVPDGYPAVFSMPWPVEEIIAALVKTRRPVTRVDRFEIRGTAYEISSTHYGAWRGSSLIGLAGSFPDTWSPERTTNHQLSQAQERLEDLTRLVSDWIWETDAEMVLTYVTPRVSEVLGFHPRELIGRNLVSLGRFMHDDPGEDANPLIATHQRPFRDRGFVMRHANGSDRQFRMAGLPVYASIGGRFCGYRGTARDITSEATALDLAAQSQGQLIQAIDSIGEGFALFDGDDRMVLRNDRFVAMYPKAASLLQAGITVTELRQALMASGDLSPDTVERMRNPAMWARRRAVEDVAFVYQLADGRWIRATDSLTADGGIVGIRTDITEIKERERALYEAKEAAEAANRAKSEFLANVSHELRTPLNAIIGFSELILGETFGPIGNPQYREYLNDVLESGRHLLNVINDILDLAKAEAGMLDLRAELMTLDEVIDSVLRLMRERAMHGNLVLSAVIDPAMPPLFADPRKLKQVLLNLVSNAVKFTPANGTVTIRTLCAPDGDILLQVEDTGIGIAPAQIQTALSPFGQVDGRLNRKYEGTGLGLPLTRAMVELHGGHLSIESTLGIGTTVTAHLPGQLVRA
ncbi:MAG TPA: ATP-binding protein [Stellaceae bacterium]|nr:ATP-binding protein [Stellaceae bacterium]